MELFFLREKIKKKLPSFPWKAIWGYSIAFIEFKSHPGTKYCDIQVLPDDFDKYINNVYTPSLAEISEKQNGCLVLLTFINDSGTKQRMFTSNMFAYL
jgi:hypothetical protein